MEIINIKDLPNFKTINIKDLPDFKTVNLVELTEDSINKIAEAIVSKLNKPMQYGRWEYNSAEYATGIPHYECNICGETVTEKTNYCPNCGAKMDGGKS